MQNYIKLNQKYTLIQYFFTQHDNSNVIHFNSKEIQSSRTIITTCRTSFTASPTWVYNTKTL